MSFNGNVKKIDDEAVLGLEGTANSLAYKIAEIERHLHSGACWFGAANTPSGTHGADRIGTCTSSFQLDAGDSSVTPTWGSWVLIFGSDDTPERDDMQFFDPHLMAVSATEGAFDYCIQFSRGAAGDDGISAGTYTEVMYCSDGNKNAGRTNLQTGRAPAESSIWARCLAQGRDTATINFYIGIHEYEG